jgi:hypothetical protein
MKELIETTLTSLRDALHRRMEQRETCKTRSTELLDTVENVVEATDNRIRAIGNYRKLLQGAVATALEFSDELVSRIPGAIEVSSRSFVSDPYVNAFFVNIGDLQAVFSHSSEIRDFMEDYASAELPHCYALLCMHRSEKTVMGMELAGDMLRKDVRQTAVSFSDHRIYSPGPSEQETRNGLKNCLFGGLVTNALERIMAQKLTSHRLQTERHALQARLRALQHNQARDSDVVRREIRELRKALETVEHDLLKLRPPSPEDSLQQLNAVLAHPDHHVRIDRCSLKLNKMGIKIGGDSDQPCNELELTEVCFGEESPRVVTLAKFPRDELQPRDEALSQQLFS